MFAAVIDRRYSRKMIVRARVVVTMDGPQIDDGAGRVMNGRIAEAGKISEVAPANDEILDLAECVIIPGLLDAHCHLDYASSRGKITPSESSPNRVPRSNS